MPPLAERSDDVESRVDAWVSINEDIAPPHGSGIASHIRE